MLRLHTLALHVRGHVVSGGLVSGSRLWSIELGQYLLNGEAPELTLFLLVTSASLEDS